MSCACSCVCVCACVCVHVCTCVHVHVCACVCVCLHVHVYVLGDRKHKKISSMLALIFMHMNGFISIIETVTLENKFPQN
jgi:hypothetical protein